MVSVSTTIADGFDFFRDFAGGENVHVGILQLEFSNLGYTIWGGGEVRVELVVDTIGDTERGIWIYLSCEVFKCDFRSVLVVEVRCYSQLRNLSFKIRDIRCVVRISRHVHSTTHHSSRNVPFSRVIVHFESHSLSSQERDAAFRLVVSSKKSNSR